jgi:glyoxylase-like metal-dependent hydrolase (beta-lactamase superfamily II)
MVNTLVDRDGGCMRRSVLLIAALCVVAATLATTAIAQSANGLRLYVFDGGVLESDPTRYRLATNEVKTSQLSVAAFLVVHPRGTLMWDSGAIADDSWTPTGGPVVRHLWLSNGQERRVTIRATLASQLASAGYMPGRITYFALSHDHWDHVANASLFAAATWLVRKVERDAMFPQPPREPPQPSTYAALQASKTIAIDKDDYDVFGDGTVVIKKAAGHTPGHQVLYVKLAKTGGVVLAGDLYHYPEERSLNRLPTAEFDQNATRAARAAIEAFLKQSGAKLWIQHDLVGFRTLKKAPQYYD